MPAFDFSPITMMPSDQPLASSGPEKFSRLKALLAAIKSKVGPAAAGLTRGEVLPGGLPYTPAESLPVSFLKSLASGAAEALPSIEDARFAAREAARMRAMGPASAGVYGALVGGPLAAREQRMAEDRSTMNAVMRLLGLQERETGLEASLLGTPREPGEKPIGEVTTPLGKKKIPVFSKPSLAEIMGASVAGAVRKQKALAPGEEAKSEAAFKRQAAKDELSKIAARVESYKKDYSAKISAGEIEDAASIGAQIFASQALANKLAAENKLPYTQPPFLQTVTNDKIKKLIIIKAKKAQSGT